MARTRRRSPGPSPRPAYLFVDALQRWANSVTPDDSRQALFLGSPTCPAARRFAGSGWKVRSLASLDDVRATADAPCRLGINLVAAVGNDSEYATGAAAITNAIRLGRRTLRVGGHIILRTPPTRSDAMLEALRDAGFPAAWQAAPVFVDEPLTRELGSLFVARQDLAAG